MQSQLECNQKKFIKFAMKKGRNKEQKKQQLKQGFPNNIERWIVDEGVGNFAWMNFDHSVLLSSYR